MVPAGSGCENAVRKKGLKGHMVFPSPFTVSNSGVGFWKVFIFGFAFASHRVVGFWKVRLGKLSGQKKLKRHMVFPPLGFWKVLVLGLFVASP